MANTITGIAPSASQQTDPVEISGASKPDATTTAQAADSSTSASQASDATELSNVATIIAASRQAAAQPAIRSQLVASLRAQIASGTYHPDPNDVAARVAEAIGT
jgi:flagellar biosynthesis anti-sigma factor FlgM